MLLAFICRMFSAIKISKLSISNSINSNSNSNATVTMEDIEIVISNDAEQSAAATKIQRKFRNFHTTRKLIDRYLKFNCPTRESARTFT